MHPQARPTLTYRQGHRAGPGPPKPDTGCRVSIRARLGNARIRRPSREFCACVHVTARLGSLRINAFLFLSTRSLVPSSRPSYRPQRSPVTLVSTRSEPYPVQSSCPAPRTLSLTAKNQRITHISSADVKSLKVTALHSTHHMTTMPQSGLGHRIWEEFGLYIGLSALSVCVFPLSF